MVKTEFFIWLLIVIGTGTHLCQATYMVTEFNSDNLLIKQKKTLDNLPLLGWVMCSTVNGTNICL
jgi:hypothetical protein